MYHLPKARYFSGWNTKNLWTYLKDRERLSMNKNEIQLEEVPMKTKSKPIDVQKE